MAFTDPATDARAAALDAIGKILRRRQALDDALRVDSIAEPRDRAFARLLTATVLRRKGQIDAVLAQCLEHAPPPPIEDVLRLGVAQLLFLETPPHAVVDSANDLAKTIGFAPFAKLVNAVLRRITAEGPGWIAAQDDAALNTPPWLWESWCATYGENIARRIARQHLVEPPLDLMPKTQPEFWAERLDAAQLFTGGLRRTSGGAIQALPGFEEGAWWVQDVAATLPVLILDPQPFERIADLCAAPGGKTMQMAARGASVTALDRSARRLARLTENLQRLDLQAQLVVADAEEWHPAQFFDKILLDAPCSATGTLRRNPDVAWTKQPIDVEKLSVAQGRLLAAAAKMVKDGGLLLYCTCSLQREEGEEQIERFLDGNRLFVRAPIEPAEVGGLTDLLTPEGDLRTLPCHLTEIGGMDGFYAARLRRTLPG